MFPKTPSPPLRASQYLRGLAAGLVAILAVATPARAQEEWTTEDIIDDRIDVDAQYALMRMMSPRDLTHHLAGSAILSAVKDGDIGGVYQADRGVPAQRAQAAGSSWWQIVPKGFDATCYKAGSGAPIIVYRKGIGGSRERLDPALRSAWESCGLPPAEPRAYRVTLHKPPPPPKPTPPGTDPPPAAGLTVRVARPGGVPVSEATVDIFDAERNMTEETGASGVVTFPDVAEGQVNIAVVGPEDCKDAYREVLMSTDPLTVDVVLTCGVPPPPPPPPACDQDKWREVFDACGLTFAKESAFCFGGIYKDYAKCALKRDPICAAKVLATFVRTCAKLDPNGRAQKCMDEANAASNCSFKGPLD